jgi:hypothetical protein
MPRPARPYSLPTLAVVALQLAIVGGLLFAVGDAWFDLYKLSRFQVAGADYSCVWAGAKAALSEPSRIYDFAHVSALQGWPLGPGRIRPYVYPPSALLIFAPFALPSYWLSFGLWVAATGALFLWAARRMGAPWPLVLLAPPVLLTAFCGQLAFLVGGLVLAALSLRHRPVLAGVLLGVAASVKPQFLVLVPIALVAEARWRTLFAAGVTGVTLFVLSSLVWGPERWLEWLGALARFRALIFGDRGLTEDAITPYAALVSIGLDGRWAFLLAPASVALVWFGFRRTQDVADRSLMLFGATLLVTPYAMNYELALFAPALAVRLSRWRDPRWTEYAAAAAGATLLPWTFAAVLPVLALAVAALVRAPDVRDPAGSSAPVFKS